MSEPSPLKRPILFKIMAVFIFTAVASFLIYKETIKYKNDDVAQEVYFEPSKSMETDIADGVHEAISDMPFINNRLETKNKKDNPHGFNDGVPGQLLETIDTDALRIPLINSEYSNQPFIPNKKKPYIQSSKGGLYEAIEKPKKAKKKKKYFPSTKQAPPQILKIIREKYKSK